MVAGEEEADSTEQKEAIVVVVVVVVVLDLTLYSPASMMKILLASSGSFQLHGSQTLPPYANLLPPDSVTGVEAD